MSGKTFDRFTTSVCFTSNKPLTDKQWTAIHERIAAAIEDAIAESENLTDQIGHVHLGSPFGNGIEVCP